MVRRPTDDRRPDLTPAQAARERERQWRAEYEERLEQDRRREEADLARPFWERLSASAEHAPATGLVWLVLLPFRSCGSWANTSPTACEAAAKQSRGAASCHGSIAPGLGALD